MHQLDYRQALKANINARSDNPDGYVSSFANVRRPDWLLNDSLDDMEWRLEPSVKSYPNSHFTLNWDLFSDSNLLGLDGYWRDLARWCTYSYMESDANECNKTSSLVAWARLNRSLFVWLCDARKCRRIEDITRADLALWEEYVRSQNLAASSVEAKLGCFKSLFTMREVFGVGIGFDPYMQNGSLIRRAKQIGAPDGHTETIEPEVLFVLVDAALNNLKNYKDVLSRLELKRQVYEEFSGGAGAYKARAGESVVRLYDDVEALYASGLVIIFVLLGERRHELHNTDVSDVASVLNEEAEELIGLVDKTALTSSGRKTSRPMTAELSLAFEVIGLLTKPLRESEGYDGGVFFLRPPIPYSANKNPSIFLSATTINTLLDKFLVHTNSELKRLRPHMFRRAFSMMWAWRFEVGELYHLSKMLYHNGSEYIRAYTEDEDVFKFLTEAQRELMARVMEDAILGDRSLHGGAGRSMRRYGRILQSKVSVVTPGAAREFVETLIDRHDYTLVPQVDGMCMMSRGRERFAKCSTDGRGPDYANRNDAHCTSCVGFGVSSSRKNVWEGRRSAHEKVLQNSDNPLVQKAARESMERAEVVLRWVGEEEHE